MLKVRVATGATYTLVLVLTVELALWESFLVAARPFGIALPVSAVLAVVGNVVLGRAGARVFHRAAHRAFHREGARLCGAAPGRRGVVLGRCGL